YQGELIAEFDRMAEEYQFLTVDARQEPSAIQRQLRRMVGDYLQTSGYHAPPELAEIAALSKPAANTYRASQPPSRAEPQPSAPARCCKTVTRACVPSSPRPAAWAAVKS